MKTQPMRRREFITLLGGAAAAWPPVAHAQQTDRLPHVGVLMSATESDPEASTRTGAFERGLQAFGWTARRNVRIDYRWVGPDVQRTRAAAAELIAASADVIVAANSPGVAVLRQATRAIPVVFVNIGDPVGQGFVASLSRPGGNITGFTGLEFSLGGKWVGFLKEIAPNVTRVSYLFHPEIGPYYSLWLGSVAAASATYGMAVTPSAVRTDADIEGAISTLATQPNGGLIVQPDAYTNNNRKLIIELAARYRLPDIYAYRFDVADGGLLSYGTDVPDVYRRCAAYVDRILKGEKPADLPVQQPLKYELVINMKTAKALGLAVPLTLQVAADEVIE
jgi:putative tryptophan/tyrosine transport system substrate-binding protein